MRAGTFGVEMVVEPASPDPPPGFDAQEAGRLWRLDPTIEIDDLRELVDTTAPLSPALLTVGTTNEGSVLVNLEHAGSLSIEGYPSRVKEFLRGASLEMTSAPWAREVPVCLVGADSRLSEGTANVELGADVAEVLREAAAAVEEAGAVLGNGGRVERERLAGGDEELAPMVVVVENQGGRELAELMALAEPHRSGVVVVGAGPVPGARWRLYIEADGTARLHPLGLSVVSHLNDAVIEGAAALLAARADTDDVAPVVELPQPDEVGPEVRRPQQDADRTDDQSISVYVRFLRRLPTVECRGRPDLPERTKLTELVHYLAASEGPVSRARLRAALWPMSNEDPFDERSLSTFSTLISRARRALGRDDSGNLLLPNSRNHSYQLGRSGWSSDWRDFRRLVRRADTASLAESVELLAEALELVDDGMLLSDVPETGYGWALTDIQDVLIRDIVDAAESLAERALAAADPERVELAARKGLAVSPCREPLWRARMQVAADLGDRDALLRAYEGARRAARSVDALAEPEPETTHLYASLRKALSRVESVEAATSSR